MIRLTALFIIALILNSCTDPLEQVPSKDNINEALEKFYQDSSKYDKNQIGFIQGLTEMLRGETAFEKDIGFEVTTESYAKVIDSVSLYLKAEAYNYLYLLDCEKTANELYVLQDQELEPLRAEIGAECERRQAEMDRLDEILEKSMTTKLTRLRTDHNEVDGGYAEFKVVYTNSTNQVITGRKVQIEFYDGFNKLIHIMNLTGSSGFRNTDVGYLYFYKNEDPEIYKKFANMKLSSFRIVTKNKTLNIGGEIIAYPEWTNTNFDYQRPSSPSSYCPYIKFSEEEEPLEKKEDAINRKYDRLLREKCEGYAELMTKFLPQIESE